MFGEITIKFIASLFLIFLFLTIPPIIDYLIVLRMIKNTIPHIGTVTSVEWNEDLKCFIYVIAVIRESGIKIIEKKTKEKKELNENDIVKVYISKISKNDLSDSFIEIFDTEEYEINKRNFIKNVIITFTSISIFTASIFI